MKCSVVGCKNNTIVPRGKSFFRFPKEENTRKKWLEALGRLGLKPSSSNVVCQDHFLSSNLKTTGRRNYLKKYAVPSIGLISDPTTNEPTESSARKDYIEAKDFVSKEAAVSATSATEVLDEIKEEQNYSEASSSEQNFKNEEADHKPSVCGPQYYIYYVSEEGSSVDPLMDTCNQKTEEVLNSENNVDFNQSSTDIVLDTSKANLNTMSYFPSTSVHSRVVQRTLIDKMVNDLKVTKCMESSDEDSTQLAPSILVKKAKLRKLRKCILEKNKIINRLRQKLKRKNKKAMKIDMSEKLKETNLIGEDN